MPQNCGLILFKILTIPAKFLQVNVFAWPANGASGHHHQDTRPPQLWNAGFIRQPGEPRMGLPDESGVPVAVSGCTRQQILCDPLAQRSKGWPRAARR
jgi:hypothetical protein